MTNFVPFPPHSSIISSNRYPIYISSSYSRGYWISNVRSTMAYWRMMAHVDLGICSDTGESNRSPVITMMPVVKQLAINAFL